VPEFRSEVGSVGPGQRVIDDERSEVLRAFEGLEGLAVQLGQKVEPSRPSSNRIQTRCPPRCRASTTRTNLGSFQWSDPFEGFFIDCNLPVSKEFDAVQIGRSLQDQNWMFAHGLVPEATV